MTEAPLPRWPGYLLPVVLIFGLAYACSLSFVYIEGDDASSIAFHALGRDISLQPPYGAYNSMMDSVLGLLPRHEPTLRIFAIALSSLANLIFALLTLTLVFEWLPGLDSQSRRAFSFVLLAACPELFFLGLFYNPSIIAMSLLLTAHLILRRGLRRHGIPGPGHWRGWQVWSLSLAVFGLGAACRWDTTIYGGVIVADLILGPGLTEPTSRKAGLLHRASFAVTWGIAALAAFLAALLISGYELGDLFFLVAWIADVHTGNTQLATVASFRPRTLLNLLSLMTPAFSALILVGSAILLVRRDRFLLVPACGAVLTSLWLPSGIPKYQLAAVPGLTACAALGFFAVWNLERFGSTPKLILRVALLALLAGPWFVGLRVYDPDISWGPGYHMRRSDAGPEAGSEQDDRQPRRRLWPVVGAGLALPTSEGPRPLGGYAPVLFGGQWRRLLLELERERDRVIAVALDRGLPLLQDTGEGFIVNHLARLGFSTSDPSAYALEQRPAIVERQFQHRDGRRIAIVRCEERAALTRGGPDLEQLQRSSGETVVIYGYGATIRDLYGIAPGALEVLGPRTAVLDLAHLRQAIDSRKGL
ncbi:MAG: hypothetical protein GY719_10860 [bacterium]|nr:hypothetical protein [bacterium]